MGKWGMDTPSDYISGLIIVEMSGEGGGCSGSICDSVSRVLIESVRDACREEVGVFTHSCLLLAQLFVFRMLVARTNVVLWYSVQGQVFLVLVTSQHPPDIPYRKKVRPCTTSKC